MIFPDGILDLFLRWCSRSRVGRFLIAGVASYLILYYASDAALRLIDRFYPGSYGDTTIFWSLVYLGPLVAIALTASLYALFFRPQTGKPHFIDRQPLAAILTMLGIFTLLVVLPFLLVAIGILQAP